MTVRSFLLAIKLAGFVLQIKGENAYYSSLVSLKSVQDSLTPQDPVQSNIDAIFHISRDAGDSTILSDTLYPPHHLCFVHPTPSRCIPPIPLDHSYPKQLMLVHGQDHQLFLTCLFCDSRAAEHFRMTLHFKSTIQRNKQGCHSTGKTWNLDVHFQTRNIKNMNLHREFSSKTRTIFKF